MCACMLACDITVFRSAYLSLCLVLSLSYSVGRKSLMHWLTPAPPLQFRRWWRNAGWWFMSTWEEYNPNTWTHTHTLQSFSHILYTLIETHNHIFTRADSGRSRVRPLLKGAFLKSAVELFIHQIILKKKIIVSPKILRNTDFFNISTPIQLIRTLHW